MTLVVSIDPIQEPHDVGQDSAGRAQFVFNVESLIEYTDDFAEILRDLLVTASVGVFGTNLFIGSSAVIPDGVGPYTSIIHSGGGAPYNTQGATTTPAYLRPTAQIVVRAKSYTAAKARARAAYEALFVRNLTVP